MKVDILCSSQNHPIVPLIKRWCENSSCKYSAELHHVAMTLKGGDFLFLISCSEIVTKEIRNQYKYSLVLHASDLPLGRGWSPHIWSILNGADELTISMIEAADPVDSGNIWAKKRIAVPRHLLFDEINKLVFDAELELMEQALELSNSNIQTTSQSESDVTYYKKRLPKDSEINPERSISEQFDLIRVSDPERFPAFFFMRGHKYQIEIKRVSDDD